MTAATGRSPLLSVVVPAYNAAGTIGACLDALERQSVPRDRYEIIVADNGSTDGTAGLLAGRDAVLVHEPRRGPAWARNAGLARARGDVVAFTDADCVPRPDWLAAITAPIAGGHADVCGGGVEPVSAATEIERFGRAWFWPVERFAKGEFFYMPFVITANAAYRHALLATIGGFDPGFPVAGYEDTDLGWRAYQAGARFALVRDAVVAHHHRTTLLGLYRMGRKGRFGRELILEKFSALGVKRPSVGYELFWLFAGAAHDLLLGNPRYERRLWFVYDYTFRLGALRGFFAGRRHLRTYGIDRIAAASGARPLLSDPYAGHEPHLWPSVRAVLRRALVRGSYAAGTLFSRWLPRPWYERLRAGVRRLRQRPLLPAVRRRPGVRRHRVLDLDFYRWVDADVLGALARHGAEIIRPPPHDQLFENDGATASVAVTIDNTHRLTAGGLRLWELAKVSVCKETGKLPGTELAPEDLPVVRKYYAWSEACLRAIERLLDEHEPDAVLVCQGGVYDSRCAVELARRRHLRCAGIENSFVGDHFFADALSGVVVNRHGLAALGGFANECEVLDEAGRSRVDELFRGQLSRKELQHRTGGIDDPASIRAALRLPADKRLVLFLGQVRADASIVLDSTVWPDPVDLVAAVADWVERAPATHLVVRLHPREQRADARSHDGRHLEVFHNATGRALEARGLTRAPHVTVVGGTEINTHALMALCDVGITVNSQAGLEMALLGKEVLTAGRCFYAGHGFTWDVGARPLLGATLDAALGAAPARERRDRLYAFAHYLFFDYLIPKALDRNLGRLAAVFGMPPADARLWR